MTIIFIIKSSWLKTPKWAPLTGSVRLDQRERRRQRGQDDRESRQVDPHLPARATAVVSLTTVTW